MADELTAIRLGNACTSGGAVVQHWHEFGPEADFEL